MGLSRCLSKKHHLTRKRAVIGKGKQLVGEEQGLFSGGEIEIQMAW